MVSRVVSKRSPRNEDGASAVEFALIAPILLLLFFGIIQYGLYFYSAQVGSNTANGAVRQLSVGNCQTAGTLQTYVDNQLGSAKTCVRDSVCILEEHQRQRSGGAGGQERRGRWHGHADTQLPDDEPEAAVPAFHE